MLRREINMGRQVLLVVTDDAVFRKTLKVFLEHRYELVTISSSVPYVSSFRGSADLILIDAGAARFFNEAEAFFLPRFPVASFWARARRLSLRFPILSPVTSATLSEVRLIRRFLLLR